MGRSSESTAPAAGPRATEAKSHSVHQSRRRGPAARVGNAENHGTANRSGRRSLWRTTLFVLQSRALTPTGDRCCAALWTVSRSRLAVLIEWWWCSAWSVSSPMSSKKCAQHGRRSYRHGTPTRPLYVRKPSTVRTHASNRNAAGRSCNTTWIAFVDADDEMQPERVERMLGHVLRHRADIGLHSFEFRRPQAIGLNSTTLSFGLNSTTSRGRHLPPDSLQPKITTPFMLWARANRTAEPIKGLGPVGELVTGSRVHLGHSFVRTAALREVPQPEGREYYRREDLAWFRRAVWTGLRAVLTDEQLSVYYACLLYTSPSPRDRTRSRMPSSA